jgi:hypothetical protein
MLRTIVTATVLFGLMCPATAEEMQAVASERLSSDELHALAPGEYVGTWKGKKQLHIFLSEDGTLEGTVNGKPQKGRWHIEDEKLCIEFRLLFLQTVRCDAVYRQAEWLISLNKKGESRIRLTRVESPTTTASIPIPKLKPVLGNAGE